MKNSWPLLEELDLVVDGTTPDHLTFCNSPSEAVKNTAFIQESAPEKLEIKRNLYDTVEPVIKKDTIISSSTSGLLISALQEGRIYPHRCVLGHPFNPPHIMPLVVVISGKKTDPRVVDTATNFYNSIGKKAIRLNKEVPGHVANRLQAAIWREAISLAVEGVASVEDIDASICYGPGIE